jgi:transcriptional regulator GlxA family with amidase domain
VRYVCAIVHRVAVYAFDRLPSFELGVAAEVFGLERPELDVPWWYELAVFAERPGPVRAVGGFQVDVPHGLEALATAQTILLPGTPDVHGEPPAAVLDALRAAHARGARLVSICSGAFVLAAAGLLDGRPATTHWRHAPRFESLFPQVKLDPAVLFVDDGDILTSAGVTAGVDLCLHVVRKDHGSEVANRAARGCVAPAWRDGGQAQFIERPVPDSGDLSTSKTRHWAQVRLHEPLALSTLADHARMSVRTFTRRFREETGMSPGQWLISQRVERARRLLESTDLPVDRIARESGFGTAAALRQQLHAVVGVSPMTYRRTFGAGVS